MKQPSLIDRVHFFINDGLQPGSENIPSEYWYDGAHLSRADTAKLIATIRRAIKKETKHAQKP